MDEGPEVPQVAQAPVNVIDLSSDCEVMEGESDGGRE
jgi:hypothetical protein